MTETDFYLSLYDSFLKTYGIDERKILWKLNAIVKLMEVSNSKKDNVLCENGLRLIMTLFKDFQFDSCDIRSSDFESSSIPEQEFLIPILIEEFK
jgi:hypothetical protein